MQRRKTHEVRVGNIGIGGNNPVRVQSMCTTSTMDTEGCVQQILAIAAAGGELVRLTTQGVREAENMKIIRDRVRAAGCMVPLVADVHFNPAAADVAALYCEKVRINPGNYVDPGRTFKKLEYTDEEYAAELTKIEDRLVPFLNICREHHTAVRIGVNHGSLSDRIMSRYGDTPAGIVESCMEFLRVCMKQQFMDVVVSIKASNTVVMVESVRLLVKAMELAPARGATLNNYGAWLCQHGNAAESLVWFDRALQLPGSASAGGMLANAGSCALDAGQVERAERDLRAALVMAPSNPVALEAMAQLNVRRGRFFEARAFAARRIAAAPATRSVLQLASEIEARLGDQAASDRYLQRIRQEFPQDAGS